MTNFLSYELMHASPEYVYKWLKKNQTNDEVDKYNIEPFLLKRNEPLINLGLALYGENPDTGFTLYKTGNDEIKKAVLAGQTFAYSYGWLLNEDILADMIRSKDLILLKHLFTNELIPDDLLIQLYEKKDLYSSLNDDDWHSILKLSLFNKRLKIIKESFPGFDNVLIAFWNLFEILPANDITVKLLSSSGYHLKRIHNTELNVKKLIEK